MNLADRSDDADVVSSHEPHLLVVFVPATGTKDMGEMETQAVHELITWNTMEDQVAENREARKTGEPEKEHSAKRKGRGTGPNCHSGDTSQLPSYRTTRELWKQSDNLSITRLEVARD